ncbi:MAG: hypothetical protein PWR13_435 [Archaeoglobi archaeon]|nr:hypothetical protein [Archaeoglobi archaeon]MDK2781407.1 hypothetical protein [Archaeoglobi archaeon]
MGSTERRKVDLCIVEFKRGLSHLDSDGLEHEDCTLWCFEPIPIVAFEIKFTWKNEILMSVSDDIEKLNDMIKAWGTKIAVLCLITDLYDSGECSQFLDELKVRIRSNRERFRIALGSWDGETLWRVEGC